MNLKPFARTLAILTILISNVGCDQISKSIVRKRIDYNEQISLMKSYVTLTKIENKGAFLSLGHSLPQPIKLLLLTILPMISLGLGFLYLMSKKNLSNMTIVGSCFIVGGGVGNIYDRLIYGSVTDFLHIDFVIFETAIFNMADVSILTGVLTLTVEVIKSRMSNRVIEKPDIR
jgi:signal peptidase II